MTLRVHFPRPRTPGNIGLLQARLDERVKLTHGSDFPNPPDYKILVAGRPLREEITSSRKLKTLVVPWAGIPRSTRFLLTEFPHIAVHNLHYNAGPTAEMVLALLLAAAKLLLPIDRSLRNFDWSPRYRTSETTLLEGKTALILGYGAIGRRVARYCQAFGMKVIGIRRRPELTAQANVLVYGPEDLFDLLAQANVLLITVPLTEETEGLLGARELARLPEGAILVNIARGEIVVEDALYSALHNGPISAAGLDVWYNYPEDESSRTNTPPSQFPFHELDNVVLSPHRAGHTKESESLRMLHLAELLNAAARRKPLPNRVDVNVGY